MRTPKVIKGGKLTKDDGFHGRMKPGSRCPDCGGAFFRHDNSEATAKKLGLKKPGESWRQAEIHCGWLTSTLQCSKCGSWFNTFWPLMPSAPGMGLDGSPHLERVQFYPGHRLPPVTPVKPARKRVKASPRSPERLTSGTGGDSITTQRSDGTD